MSLAQKLQRHRALFADQPERSLAPPPSPATQAARLEPKRPATEKPLVEPSPDWEVLQAPSTLQARWRPLTAVEDFTYPTPADDVTTPPLPPTAENWVETWEEQRAFEQRKQPQFMGEEE